MKKKLSGKFCPRVGVFATKFMGHYQLELISGIEKAARRLNVQVIYFCGCSLQSPHPYEENHNMVYDTAVNASLDGLILFSILANFCDDNVLSDFISRYKNIPVVTVNLQSSVGNAILSNNAIGFNALMKHLIKEHNYRKFAFIKGPEYSLNALECYNIFKFTLAAAGLPIDPALVTTGDFRYLSGKEAISELLDNRGLEPGRDMDVIVSTNDTMAIGVIDELYKRGLHVPGDIAVTGFDNAEESIFPKASLTTVKQYLREIGDRAVCTLLDYKPHQEPLYYDTELIIRNSCGCFHPTNKIKPSPGLDRKSEYIEKVKFDVHKLDLEFIFQEILSTLDSLKVLQNMKEFTPWMKIHFPNLGINSAWFFLTSDISSGMCTYKCIAGYDLQEPGRERPAEELKENMIFDDFMSKKQDRSFCVLPLLFKDEKYGLMVTEVNEIAYLAYDTMSQHIGSTIKNILLDEEVVAMNLQLRQSNEQKTQFFINIAHETRTPLTLIQNYLELYMKQQQFDEKLLVIKQNIDFLVSNIVNFLDVEKLQKGEMIYQHDSLVDLSKSAREKYTIFQAMALKKKIRIKLNIEDHIIIRIDPWALDRIFNNLLGNAVKYIQTGGQIIISVWREASKTILRISDNGPGLPTYAIQHIFEPYYLLSKKKTQKQGIGVGLSIVKKIIDGMGATIDVKNNKEGGTCFTITFRDFSPAEQGNLQEIPATKPASLKVLGKIRDQKIDINKCSLLVVDDNIQLLKFMQTALDESYNIYLARSTTEALAKLKAIPRLDLIISDIMMDGPDGYQLLKSISENKKYNNIPFIFLTGLGSQKEIIKGLGLGAVDYIEKPFSITALKTKIKSIIALRRRQVEQDRMHFHNKIDEIFSDSSNITNDSERYKIDRFYAKYKLVGREREIAQMIINGLMHKEIASSLNLSQSAVEYHITKIYKKSGVNNKYDFIKKFQE